MKYLLLSLFSLLVSGSIQAADTGLIDHVSFASTVTVASNFRPGTAQFEIVGGFTQQGCNNRYAAISNEDSHLISLLLSAQAQGKPVEVHLDPTKQYYSDRCLVSFLALR